MKHRIVAVALALSTLSGLAAAGDPRFWANDIRTLFFIGKSDDRDEVHYGIHLDKDCMPIGNEPVYVYWQQIEQGPNVTEDLNFLDRTVYGVKSQSVTKRSPEESRVVMTLRATSDRSITVVTKKQEGQCVADSIAMIGGVPARLDRVFVHVAGWLSVDWIDIKGTVSGRPIVERVKR